MSAQDLANKASECSGMTLAECIKKLNVGTFSDNWCAWFAKACGSNISPKMNFGSSYVAKEIKGINGNYTFKAGAQGTTANKPKVGDLLFIQPQNQTGVKHVGICCAVTSTTISSWEGNMSNSDFNKSTVKKATYNYNTGDGGSWGKILQYGSNN